MAKLTSNSSLRSLAYFGVHTSYHSLLCRQDKTGLFDEIDACLGNELVRYRVQQQQLPSAVSSSALVSASTSTLFPQRVLERVSHRKMHDAVLSDAVRSPCNRSLFSTCSYDDRLRIWTDNGSGNYHLLACEPCGNVKDALVVDQLCWAPCGTRLVSTTRVAAGPPRGRMQVWGFEEGKLTEVARLEGPFQKALFNKDGNVLAFRRQENAALLYEIKRGALVQLASLSLPSSSSGMCAFSMSPDLSTLVCCTRAKQLFHINASTLTLLLERPMKVSRAVTCMAMLDEQRLIYSPCSGRLVVATVDSEYEQTLPGPPQSVLAFTFTTDRSRVISATVDGLYVQALPLASPSPLKRPSVLSRFLPSSSHAAENDVKQHGISAAPSISESKHHVEDHNWSIGGVQFHSVAGCGVDVSSTGNFLASGDLGCKLVIWDLDRNFGGDSKTNNSASSFSACEQFSPVCVHQLGVGVRSLKWLPHSHSVLVGCLDGQLFLATLDPKTQNVKSSCVYRAKAAINCIEIRPRAEGTQAVLVDSAGNATLLHISLPSCRLLYEWQAHPPVHSSDPTYRQRFGSIHRAADVWSCVWDPDGNLLATCSEDQSTRIWDMRGEPRLLQILRGHTLAVTCVDWVIRDGQALLATCADDRRVMLWETRTPALPGNKLGYCENLNCFSLATSGCATCAAHTQPVCTLRHVFTAQSITTDVSGWFTFTYLRFVGGHLVVGTENGYVLVLDVDSRHAIHARCIHRGSIEGLCFHQSGMVATISSDCSIALHRLLHHEFMAEHYGFSHM